MKKYRIGLIGLGGMAQAHIRWMAAEGRFEVIAVSDVNEAALIETSNRLGISTDKRHADYHRVVQDPDVDAIVSVTPNHIHADVIRACLQAGKPFMAEKPFTRTFEEAVPLLDMYKRQTVPAIIGFSYRYTPAFRYARELVREGKLGAIRSFSIQYLQGWGAPHTNTPYVWRFDKAKAGTGTLGDLGSHMIDTARFLFGEFAELSAQLQTIIPERPDPVTGEPVKVEVDDFASFLARMTGDAMGVFQTTRNAVGSDNQHEVSIYGDFGTIHASTCDPDRLVWIREEGPGERSRVKVDVPEHCKVSQHADFLALLDGLEPDGMPGFMDGYRNQEVLDAILRSSAEKASIRLQHSPS